MSEKKFPFEFKDRIPFDIERQRLIDELTQRKNAPVLTDGIREEALKFWESLKNTPYSGPPSFTSVVALGGIEDTLKPRDK